MFISLHSRSHVDSTRATQCHRALEEKGGSYILPIRADVLKHSQVEFAQLFRAQFMTASKRERGISEPTAYQED
jgi:hypothetical protein